MKKMNDTLFEELYALLTGKGLKELKDALSEMPYPDIAEFIMALDDELDEEKLAVLIESLDRLGEFFKEKAE